MRGFLGDFVNSPKNYGLLKYLLRNGYIDESYAAYISYFYPNSLTAQDRNFLLSIADRAPLEYDYRLDRPDTVLDRLEEADFSRQEVRNFDLMAYLLRTENPKLHIFLQSGGKDGGTHLFCAEFWRTGRKSTRAFRFIRALYREQPAWFRMWCEDERILLEGEWRSFILDALYFLPPEYLKRINWGRDWLTKRISSDPDFLHMDRLNIRRLIPALKALNIRFCEINYREADVPLVQEIYRENLYALNLSTLKTGMAVFWGVPPEEAERCSYSHIFRHPEEPLSLRVLGEIDAYADAILNGGNARFCDDEEAVVNFLNCEALSESYKGEYIRRSDTVLGDINAVASRALWPTLVENQSVAYTWQNIADYFVGSGKGTDQLPSELTNFINNGNSPLNWGYDELNQRMDKLADNLRRAVLVNEDLSMERYQTALAGMNFLYQSFPFAEISVERMKIVLDLEIVPVTVENVGVIRESYPQLWNDFILPKGARELTKLMNHGDIQLTESELASLLEDSRMTGSIAEKMLSIFSETISLQNRTFPNDIRTCIVKAHLNPEEIPLLLKSFEQESPDVQAAFLDYTREHTVSVADEAKRVEFIPVNVYAICIAILTKEWLLALRPYISDDNFEIVCAENRRPKFPDTPEVRDILNAFMAYHWISS